MKPPSPGPARDRCSGFSLPEILVVSTLAIVLLSLSAGIISNTYAYYRRSEISLGLDASAMLAMTHLGSDLSSTHHSSVLLVPLPDVGQPAVASSLIYPLPEGRDENGRLLWSRLVRLSVEETETGPRLIRRQSPIADPALAPPPLPTQIPLLEPESVAEDPRVLARDVERFSVEIVDKPPQLLVSLTLARQTSHLLKVVVRTGFAPRN